jgi:hypothetical protein
VGESSSNRKLSLSERLSLAGIPAGANPLITWVRLREVEGQHATVIDLYRLVSEPRGLEPHELPLVERRQLSFAIAPTFWPGFEVTDGSERFDPPTTVNGRPGLHPGGTTAVIFEFRPNARSIHHSNPRIPSNDSPWCRSTIRAQYNHSIRGRVRWSKLV